jgi:hypothetical protein
LHVAHNGKASPTLDLDKLEDFERQKEDEDLLNDIMLKPPSKQHQGHHFMEVQAEHIKEWEEYICVLEKEMPTLEVVMDSLKKVKDEADREFTKVEGQV